MQTYFKGTKEHGVILGVVDEILLNVDNDVMNLQSMAGSRFVGPFLNVIQRWEKDLSLICETIEVGKPVLVFLIFLLCYKHTTWYGFLGFYVTGQQKVKMFVKLKGNDTWI